VRRIGLIGQFLIVATFYLVPSSGEPTWASDRSPCNSETFEGRRYVICEANTRVHDVVVASQKGQKQGGTIGSLLSGMSSAQRSRVAFAMNGGMYEPDFTPVGLLVEHGEEKAKINTSDGFGNFYWKPNGIFYVTNGVVAIKTTDAYVKAVPTVEFATQSGPLLVLEGNIDTRILSSSSSRNIRNGVGVRDAHTAIFVISEEPVSFSEFARLFRDKLRCSDALYFDGVISELFAPSANRRDRGGTLGPIVVVSQRP